MASSNLLKAHFSRRFSMPLGCCLWVWISSAEIGNYSGDGQYWERRIPLSHWEGTVLVKLSANPMSRTTLLLILSALEILLIRGVTESTQQQQKMSYWQNSNSSSWLHNRDPTEVLSVTGCNGRLEMASLLRLSSRPLVLLSAQNTEYIILNGCINL